MHEKSDVDDSKSVGMGGDCGHFDARNLDHSYADVDDEGASSTLFRTSISVGENLEINLHDIQCHVRNVITV